MTSRQSRRKSPGGEKRFLFSARSGGEWLTLTGWLKSVTQRGGFVLRLIRGTLFGCATLGDLGEEMTTPHSSGQRQQHDRRGGKNA